MSLNLLSGCNIKLLDILDWREICSDISKSAYFINTVNEINKAPTSKKSNLIKFEYDSIDQFLENIDLNQELIQTYLSPLAFENNYRDQIKSLQKSRILNLKELGQVASIFESFLPLQKAFSSFQVISQLFPSETTIRLINKEFLRPIRLIISNQGDINYNGHPQLKECMNELQLIEKSLRKEMSQISRIDLYKDCLAFEEFDIVNDHYVLAIKADRYTYEHGPIIDKSNSGLTLFVEPFSLRIKCDKRLKLLARIDEIISKICINFSNILSKSALEFENIFEILLTLDLLNCKASYSYSKGLIRPEITNNFNMDIQGFFHPLIENPIPNSINLSEEKSGLIISGPNTGGKTVTLKSLAISQMFLHMGLFIPAVKAKISPINNIYFLGNEGQDLKEGLSSFAQESKNYLEILDNLGDKNLIIIDEIFNSTSSEEASALAISLFDEILSRSDTKFLVSTHHQFLKSTIHSNKNFVSSHVGFDLESNLPTYKLYTDGPGSSLAFTIFDNLSQKHSTPNLIASKAEKLLDKKQISYDNLLQELSFKRTELDRLVKENRDLNFHLKNQKKSMEGVLFLEKEEAHKQYKIKLNKVLGKARLLRDQASTEEKLGKKQHQKAEANLQIELEKYKAPTQSSSDQEMPTGLVPAVFKELKIGQKLYSKKFKKEVLITKLNSKNNQIHIKAGALGVWTKIEDLYFHHSFLKTNKSIIINIEKSRKELLEYDCRGMRLDEFEKIALNSINDLLSGTIPYVTLIHGHGSGVLKSWLRKLIKEEYPQINWEAPNGNDGCSELKLKEA